MLMLMAWRGGGVLLASGGEMARSAVIVPVETSSFPYQTLIPSTRVFVLVCTLGISVQ